MQEKKTQKPGVKTSTLKRFDSQFLITPPPKKNMATPSNSVYKKSSIHYKTIKEDIFRCGFYSKG